MLPLAPSKPNILLGDAKDLAGLQVAVGVQRGVPASKLALSNAVPGPDKVAVVARDNSIVLLARAVAGRGAGATNRPSKLPNDGSIPARLAELGPDINGHINRVVTTEVSVSNSSLLSNTVGGHGDDLAAEGVVLGEAVGVHDGVGHGHEGHVGGDDVGEVGGETAGAVSVEGLAGVGVEGVERAGVDAGGVSLLERGCRGGGDEAEGAGKEGGVKHLGDGNW